MQVKQDPIIPTNAYKWDLLDNPKYNKNLYAVYKNRSGNIWLSIKKESTESSHQSTIYTTENYVDENKIKTEAQLLTRLIEKKFNIDIKYNDIINYDTDISEVYKLTEI